MSQWTHVSGCIRVDGLPELLTERMVRDVFGWPSTNPFLPHDKYFHGRNIPGGSEGTLQYEIIKAGDGLVMYTVAVWGDLRDVGADDTDALVQWFTRIVTSGLLIRSASLLVEVEHGPAFVLLARHDRTVTQTPVRIETKETGVAEVSA